MKSFNKFLLLAACTLPFMILIVSGLSIYLSNRNEIVFNFLDIILPLMGLFLLLSIFLFLLLLFFRRYPSVFDILTGLLVGLSWTVWVQSQLLVWNFGHFNGQNITWDKWRVNMYIEGALWIVIIGVVLTVFIKRKHKIGRAFVSGIYFLGCISVIIAFMKAPDKIERTIDESEYSDIFSFHPKNNVLIILLDDFQSDYFEAIATKYPAEVADLDGFTFYRNTISRFPTTKASLPSIMTGTLYRNEGPYKDYITESYKKFNIIQAYKAKSYSTSFVGQLEGVFPDIISMENVAYKRNNAYFYNLFEYLDYGVFRALPTFLKPVIFNNGNWFFTFLLRSKYPPKQHGADVRFLELLEKNASVNSTKEGTFKFLHFFIPHAPWRVNENLQFDPGLMGDKGYLRQTRGAIRLASRILETLKKISIYDNSEIIIMSDHGTGSLPSINHKNIYYETLYNVPSYVQSSSLALLLHKPVNSNGKLITSDVPLELTDLSCLLGLRSHDTICSDFSIAKSGGLRERTFYYYEWGQEYWGTEFLPPMTEYCISGPANSSESYSLGKFIFTSKGAEKISSPSYAPYTPGKEILFSSASKGEADPYIRGGWSPAESYQRWTDGPVAGLSFLLEKAPQKDLLLRLYAFGYLGHNKINCQMVTILVNQEPVGRWLVKEDKWYEASIPKKLVPDGIVTIIFKISNPMSPEQSEKSKDVRKLGIGAVKLVLEEVK